MLDEFKAYSKDNIQYDFINPLKSEDKKVREAFQKDLYKAGLRPTSLNIKENNGLSKKIVWPGAIFTYRGKTLSVNFLKNQLGTDFDQMVNSSIESLEYEIANIINQITTIIKPKVAIIEGHGELNQYETASLRALLSPFYNVERLVINENLKSLTKRKQNISDSSIVVVPKFKAIIIAKPTLPFSEKDKFIIDQYIMYGGRVIWAIDGVKSNMDSLKNTNFTFALDLNLNLGDQLFTYGVRINNNLIQSPQATPVPIITGMVGNKPKTELVPWFFYPILKPAENHPIVSNLNLIKTEFISSIDTNSKSNIKKYPLLFSSKPSKINNTPTRISLSSLTLKPDLRKFNKPEQMVAVLLSGKFESLYKNRGLSKVLNNELIKFRNESKYTHQIIIGDGDITKNIYNKYNNQFLPIGFDRYTNTQFGNADFMLNAFNFLCDDQGFMEVRNKQLKIRLLNKNLTQEAKLYWKIFNTTAPILLIIILGLVYSYFRKKKYAS